MQAVVLFALPFYGSLRTIGLAVVAMVGVGTYKFIFGSPKLAPPNAGYPSKKGFPQEIQMTLRNIRINGGQVVWAEITSPCITWSFTGTNVVGLLNELEGY